MEKAGIIRDKTMEDKFMYIPDNNKQNYSFMDLNNKYKCILYFVYSFTKLKNMVV